MSNNQQLKKGDIALTGVGYILVIGNEHKNTGMLHIYALMQRDDYNKIWKLESTNASLFADERIISEVNVADR